MENVSLSLHDVQSFLQQTDKVKGKNPLTKEPVYLSLVYKKIPHKRQLIRFKLEHDLQPSTVCVFTKDIYGKDYEKTADHYTNLAKTENVRKDVTFMPLNELTVCYMEFEAKRKLSATFDMFLADQTIIHRLPSKLGKPFYSKKKLHPFPVNLEGNLAEEISRATSSMQLVIQAKGSSESCIIGYEDLKANEIYDNILSAVQIIPTKWPGGLENIRSMSIDYKKSSLSIFYSTSQFEGSKLPKDNKIVDTFKADIKAVLKDLPAVPVNKLDIKTTKRKTNKKFLSKNKAKPVKPNIILNKANKSKIVKKKKSSSRT